jgi:hypothetical protein
VIKEKRYGRIKGHTVADGRPQRALYMKEVTMMAILIDAWEHSDVATSDVAVAYLHAKLDNFTLLKMEGGSVDIMCSICKECKNA